MPIELLGRESFTWRFWRAPSWALAVVTGGLVAAGMTLGLVENLRDGSGGLGMMVFFGLILLVIWVTVLDALVGRTRGDASGLHVRTLFGSCHLQWEDVYSALQIRGGGRSKRGMGERDCSGARGQVRARYARDPTNGFL